MILNKKIVIFDLDGTLTESKQKIRPDVVEKLKELPATKIVAIISGAGFKDFERQFLSVARPIFKNNFKNLYILPLSGSSAYEFDSRRGAWRKMYSSDFKKDLKVKIVKLLAEIVQNQKFQIPAKHYGPCLEDRGAQITFSALGGKAPLNKKITWDPNHKKRARIRKEIKKRIRGLDVSIGGTTSIDILPKGQNKGSGILRFLKKIKVSPKDAVFIGDAIFPGGNDYSVKRAGIETVVVDSQEKISFIIASFKKTLNVAYFCMEYGIEDDLPLYAGGLGVLAGDFVLGAGEYDNLNFMAFGLVYRRGLKHSIQKKSFTTNKKLRLLGFKKVLKNGTNIRVPIPLYKNKSLLAEVWRKSYGNSTLYLLDVNISKNTTKNRGVCNYLYDDREESRIHEQLVLGIGANRLMRHLNITPDIFHFNEGHTAFGALSTILEYNNYPKKIRTFTEKMNYLRNSIVATKHTILSGANTYISREKFKKYLGSYLKEMHCDPEELYELGALDRDPETFSTTKFLIEVASRSSGVSKAHIFFEKKQYPQSKLIPITNGVDINRWQFGLFSNFPIKDISNIKRKLRSKLVDFINKNSPAAKFDKNTMTIVWARRLSTYKRPGLLFNNEEKLLSLINDFKKPIQIIIAGKSHPMDIEGMRALTDIRRISRDPKYNGRVSFVENYSLSMAKILTFGADAWLNTPIPELEACGTSGMKAGLNGAIILSTNSGWVGEISNVGKIGYIIPETDIENEIYNILKKCADSFYSSRIPGNSAGWIGRAKETINLIESKFSIKSTIDNYIQILYTG